jgi:hypothetical protein
VPLRVRHLEQINLRNCAGNIEQGIDPAKAFKRRSDDCLCGLRFT